MRFFAALSAGDGIPPAPPPLPGSHTHTHAHCDAFIARRVAKVRRVLGAVSTIADTEVAFKVVKSCINYGGVMHLLRAVPFSAAIASFAAFDDAVSDAFGHHRKLFHRAAVGSGVPWRRDGGLWIAQCAAALASGFPGLRPRIQ